MSDTTYSDPKRAGLTFKAKDTGEGYHAEIMAAADPAMPSGVLYRPANTTQFATNDVVGISVSVVGVTAHSDGLCLVEVGASVIDTILADGDFVTIASVGGCTEANGNNQITKVDATHFTIPVTFANAYTSGGTITKDLQIELSDVAGLGFFLNWLKVAVNSTTTTNAQFAAYLHTDQVTAIADNAQATMLDANVAKSFFLGVFTLTGGGTGSDSIMDLQDINRYFKLGSTSKRVYIRLVNISATGWVPTSAAKFTVVLGIN